MSLLAPPPGTPTHTNTQSITRKRSFTTSTPPPLSAPKRARHPSRTPLPAPSYIIPRSTSFHLTSRLPTHNNTTIDLLPALSNTPISNLGMDGFTVLCFVGSSVEVLAALQEVKGLLAGLGAVVYAVCLQKEQAQELVEMGGEVDVVHDKHRALTQSLGLLHPMGAGRMALDAVVVLDRERRVRCTLPVGWGCRGDEAGGNRVENVVGRVVGGVEWLLTEKPVLCGEDVEEAVCVEVEMGG